jgi:hypothetical protein
VWVDWVFQWKFLWHPEFDCQIWEHAIPELSLPKVCGRRGSNWREHGQWWECP